MKTYQYSLIVKKYGFLILVIIWLMITSQHLYFTGLFSKLEADKYIREANRLVEQKGLSAKRFIFYSPTILLIFFSIKLKAGLYGAFILQALYNLFVTLFFYKTLQNYFEGYLYPFIVTFLLIIFLPYSNWIVYLYTESIFFSNILLLTTFVLRYKDKKNKKNFLLLLLSLLLVILSRPLGILFLFPALVYFFVQANKKNKLIFLVCSLAGLTFFVYVSNVVFSTTEDASITLAASQQCIVCGVIPTNSAVLKMADHGSPFFQLFYYVTNNFSNFLQLGLKKLSYFFLMTRNYYSVLHNAFLLLFLVPLYLLSLVYCFSKKEKSNQPVYLFQLTSIVLFALAVMLQCDDYHNRFSLSLFPFFLLMGFDGLRWLRSTFKKNIKPPSLS